MFNTPEYAKWLCARGDEDFCIRQTRRSDPWEADDGSCCPRCDPPEMKKKFKIVSFLPLPGDANDYQNFRAVKEWIYFLTVK